MNFGRSAWRTVSSCPQRSPPPSRLHPSRWPFRDAYRHSHGICGCPKAWFAEWSDRSKSRALVPLPPVPRWLLSQRRTRRIGRRWLHARGRSCRSSPRQQSQSKRPTASPPRTEQQPQRLDPVGGSGDVAGGAGVGGGSGGGCCTPHHPPTHPTPPTLPNINKANNIDHTPSCQDKLLNARLEVD